MTARWLYAWALGSVPFGGASLLVPLYLVQLGATPFDLGVLAATAAVIGAPGAVVFGRLADGVRHRRGLVIATLATVALALAALPLLTRITAIIAANAALWLVVASVAPVLTMLVVDDAPEPAWGERIGLLNKYQGYGWAGGLVLGAVWPLVAPRVVGGLATRALFWLLAGVAGASALGAARTLPRPAPEDHVTAERKVRRIATLLSRSGRGVRGATFAFHPNRLYWTTRAIDPRRLRGRLDPALVTYLLAAALFFTGFAAFWAPLPLFLATAGFTSGAIFALYLVSSLGSAVLYVAAGAAAARYDVRLLQSGALAVRGLLFPATVLLAGMGGLPTGLLAVGAGLVAIGLTWAVIAVVGTAIVTRLASPAVRGEVLGVHAALSALAGGAGGLLGGWIASGSYRLAFAAAGGLVLAGAALVLSLRVLAGGERVWPPRHDASP